jgi:isoquinoline 1-oxidoreductase alpha subunit
MKLLINQHMVEASAEADTPLVWVLRDDLGLTGTKFGCGIGICGACTVHIDGVATRSCQIPISSLEGKAITTIEGLSGGSVLHPVQRAFLEAQVPQCAWCMSGQMMTAAAFLQQNSQPSAQDIEAALSNNYCRCGCYTRIRTAVAQAAKDMQVG